MQRLYDLVFSLTGNMLFIVGSLNLEVCFASEILDNYGIPRKIWQTYRYKELPNCAEQARASWIELNPNYEYTFMDDNEIDEYVRINSDIGMYEFFKAMPIGVMKADIWRYLIITEKGGVYADIDTICSVPIDRWLSFAYSLRKVIPEKPILFIGMENNRGFCQWTLVATPRHPAMEFACRYLLHNWRQKGLSLHSHAFVHITTGPTIWKSAILEYIDEPISTTTDTVWQRYNIDKDFRKRVNDLGIYFLSPQFFNGFAVIHLNGSSQFKEGYISWRGEGHLYRMDPKNHRIHQSEEFK